MGSGLSTLVTQLPSLSAVSASGALCSSEPHRSLTPADPQGSWLLHRGPGEFLGNGFPRPQEAIVEPSRNWRKGQHPASSLPSSCPCAGDRHRPPGATGPSGCVPVFPEAPSSLRPDAAEAAAETLPSAATLSPHLLGPGTPLPLAWPRAQRASFSHRPPRPPVMSPGSAPWEPESAPLSGPRANPQDPSRGCWSPWVASPVPGCV